MIAHRKKSARMLRKPRSMCMFASIVALIIWFVGFHFVVNWIKPINNPAGIPVYAVMCLALSTVLLPLNASFIAPKLTRLSFASTLGTVVVHLVVGIALFGFAWFWPSVIQSTPSTTWTIIPYYLSIFLIPPMIVGSFAYSLSYNRSMKEIHG